MKKLLLILLVLGLGFGVSAQSSSMVKNLGNWPQEGTFFYRFWVIEHMIQDGELQIFLNKMVADGWEITMTPLPISPDRKYPTAAYMIVTFKFNGKR